MSFSLLVLCNTSCSLEHLFPWGAITPDFLGFMLETNQTYFILHVDVLTRVNILDLIGQA